MLDRLFTASPVALSGTLEEDEDEQTVDMEDRGSERAGLDPDGMLIDDDGDLPTVPNSPDKTLTEVMLFPER
jgi:hypothetical protein